MKRKLTLLLIAVLLATAAFAQFKAPTLPKVNSDTIYPEIVVYLGFGEYLHYQHPATEMRCVSEGRFRTLDEYQQYQWEVNEEFLPLGGDLTESSIFCIFNRPGYLKVTVWDSLGNSGTDSIWFNIKDFAVPISDFTMEIDSANHAVFSGTVTEQRFIGIRRSLDTLNWTLVYDHYVSPGHWSWRDDEVHFGIDTIWNYTPWYTDSCGNATYPEMVPGMMMSTQPSPGGGWYLTLRTILQSRNENSDDYVYPIFTIDQDGVRHELRDEQGEPIILPASANSLLLSEHPDKYYQGAVAKLNRETRNYEIVSLSNKVENPLPDVNSVNENKVSPLHLYPNPCTGSFTVKGEGILTIVNVLGQTVFQKEIDSESQITLPNGIYVARLHTRDGNTVQKVVVK